LGVSEMLIRRRGEAGIASRLFPSWCELPFFFTLSPSRALELLTALVGFVDLFSSASARCPNPTFFDVA